MASSELIRTLVDLSKTELKENKLAQVITYYYDRLDKRDHAKLYESLVIFYLAFDESKFSVDDLSAYKEGNIDLSAFRDKDYRIKNLQISNTRGIPGDPTDIPFGINFTNDNEINSAVILGPNGTGKSSIVSALEMIYTQEIGEKKLRTRSNIEADSREFHNYLKRLDFDSMQPACIVETPAGKFSLNDKVFKDKGVLKIINPSNHFISDYDIYEYGKLSYSGVTDGENSFHYLIAQSLGLQEFLDLQNLVQGLSQYNRQKDSRTLNVVVQEKKTHDQNISDWTKEVMDKEALIKNKDAEKRTKSAAIPRNFSNEQLTQVIEAKNRRFKSVPTQTFFIELLDSFEEDFLKFSGLEDDQLRSVENGFLTAGIELLNHSKDCPFCQNSKVDLNEIRREVEIRLLRLRETENNQLDLKNSFTQLQDSLKELFRALPLFWDELTKERDGIKSITQLSSLMQMEDHMYTKLTPLVYDPGLFDFVNDLEARWPNVFDRFRALFKLIQDNKDMFKVSLPHLLSEIEDFISFRNQELTRVIDTLQESVKGERMSLDQEIRLINNEIASTNLRIENAKKRSDALNLEIARLELDVETFRQIKSEASTLGKVFQIKVNAIVNDIFGPIKETIEDILRDYFSEEKGISIDVVQEPRMEKIESTGETITTSILIARITKKEGSGRTVMDTPDHYFNTFRYRLFCLMVSLSVAIATRVKYRINLPLILDDLFFASDYISKATFSVFLNRLIGIFKKYSTDLPVQFIIFTHDDLIFSSSMDALEGVENKNTLFGRLFKPSDRDSAVSELEDGTKFWNLVFTLPTTVDINDKEKVS